MEGNDLPKSQVLSSEWKTERVREDASGDREDGEEDDDELPCVISESDETNAKSEGHNPYIALSLQLRWITYPRRRQQSRVHEQLFISAGQIYVFIYQNSHVSFF